MNPETPKSANENEEPVSPDTAELSESEAKVEDAFAKLQEELTQIHDRYLRLGAEFENFKKRSERERLTSIRFANENLLSELLPVLDHLEQAIVAANTHSAESVVSGVQIVLKQFKDVLSKSGLKEFESKGQQFNPNLHEALAERESDEHEAGTIIEEYQKGYMLNDRLVRAARVVVSKKPKSE